MMDKNRPGPGPGPGPGYRIASGDDWKDERCEMWSSFFHGWISRGYATGSPFDGTTVYRIPDDQASPDQKTDETGQDAAMPSLSSEQQVAAQQHHGGDHYQGLAIQPWDYATANRMEYNEGVVVAYVTRWRSKGGVQDLYKAIDHIRKLIEYETKRNAEKQAADQQPSADAAEAARYRDAVQLLLKSGRRKMSEIPEIGDGFRVAVAADVGREDMELYSFAANRWVCCDSDRMNPERRLYRVPVRQKSELQTQV